MPTSIDKIIVIIYRGDEFPFTTLLTPEYHVPFWNPTLENVVVSGNIIKNIGISISPTRLVARVLI